jgi:ABC-2 type transport system ATP-binding protein
MTALQIQNLTKTYAGGVQALRGINLQVEQGDFFALLGPNGAGKSTAIGIVSSLVNKTSGSVKIFGHDLDTDLVAAKSCIGLVPQEFNFNGFEAIINTVTNVAGFNGISGREARKRAEHYLKRLDLWDKRNETGRSLSGGMKRRLMIARALVHEPKLLILDEPTAGVDIEIRRSMWEYLSQINAEQGITIILTTHYLEEAEALCRNVAIIDKGEIIENGSVARLLSTSMQETFVLDIDKPLANIPDVTPFEIRQRSDEHQIEVDVPQGETISALFSVLSAHGIMVASMRNKSNRLEEFFLRLVNESKSESA